jgi:hypothetical protein
MGIPACTPYFATVEAIKFSDAHCAHWFFGSDSLIRLSYFVTALETTSLRGEKKKDSFATNKETTTLACEDSRIWDNTYELAPQVHVHTNECPRMPSKRWFD